VADGGRRGGSHAGPPTSHPPFDTLVPFAAAPEPPGTERGIPHPGQPRLRPSRRRSRPGGDDPRGERGGEPDERRPRGVGASSRRPRLLAVPQDRGGRVVLRRRVPCPLRGHGLPLAAHPRNGPAPRAPGGHPAGDRELVPRVHAGGPARNAVRWAAVVLLEGGGVPARVLRVGGPLLQRVRRRGGARGGRHPDRRQRARGGVGSDARLHGVRDGGASSRPSSRARGSSSGSGGGVACTCSRASFPRLPGGSSPISFAERKAGRSGWTSRSSIAGPSRRRW